MDILTIERVNNHLVYIVPDEGGSLSDPRQWDNLSHIYGKHRDYTIGDGEPPADELAALERGGTRLLARYLRRCKGMVAMTGLAMYDHSGITYYSVPVGSTGHHVFDSAGWDSGTVGYAYVTRADLEKMGTDEADAGRIMQAEIDEYDAWARGSVFGYVIAKPCSDPKHADDEPATIADCPHTEVVRSVFGFIGNPDDIMTEARAEAMAWTDD